MPGAPFVRGLNNAKYHDQVIASTTKAIDACADAGFPAVIAFTGYKYVDADNPKSAVLSRDDGEKNCVAALKKLATHAERRRVTVCLEHLNTRDDTHPMKGHPGYQGDDLDWVAGIIRKVGSERVKLLFDVYGRGELDDEQEINYPAVMKKLVRLKYAGYVGQEFIPTRNPLAGLRQAVRLCDV
jgi:hydroxypyruvate isomerase